VTYTPPEQYQPAQTVVQTVTATAVSSVSYGITSTTTITGLSIPGIHDMKRADK